ncbi:glutamine amidotransferase [uncultured Jatrophihabitans sp.]|uniref:glutamine amidotransferase n=1 Tax=uncultured Jatrophihabitans sp. TaxID=1610747 RepID=UPI0035C99797
MCGIAGLHLRHDTLRPRLGTLTAGMLRQLADRGTDSAGVAVYGDPRYVSPPGGTTVGVLAAPGQLAALSEVAELVPAGPTTVVRSALDPDSLLGAVREAVPDATITSWGSDSVVLKGAGHPAALIDAFGVDAATGWQAVGHTRMATESAVTAAGSHPFSAGADISLVHNGSFSNHATIRRELIADGVRFDSDNDSEVGARFIAHQLAGGADLDKALRLLCERFDGFYTLLVTTADSFAVVRDAIACKPAVVAETTEWVAMASEYRALTGLPGIENALIFEPEPEEVYTWKR